MKTHHFNEQRPGLSPAYLADGQVVYASPTSRMLARAGARNKERCR